MEQPIQNHWNSPCPSPLRYKGECYSFDRENLSRSKRYDVEPQSFPLFIGASSAKKAKWITSEIKNRHTTTLPPENIAAIKLLDSWLNEDAQDHSKEWEEIKSTINENRLSDRKPFS